MRFFELSYTSSPTAYIGAGKSETIRPSDGWNFGIQSGPARSYLGDTATDYVSISLRPTADNSNPYGFWDVQFAMPVGQKLAAGTYSATRFPFQPNDSAGMNFDGMGRGDNALHGTFQILSIGFESNGLVSSFAADFEQWDEYIVGAWNRGSIRYNYDVTSDPVTQTPEPSTMALGLFAIPAIGLVVKSRRSSLSGDGAGLTRQLTVSPAQTRLSSPMLSANELSLSTIGDTPVVTGR